MTLRAAPFSYRSIQAAHALLKGKAVTPTHIFASAPLSEEMGCKITICSLMGDGVTGTNSFKDLGAYVKLSEFVGDEDVSICVASEGNHAPGVLNAARLIEAERGIKISVQVFVPETISDIKRGNIQSLIAAHDNFDTSTPDFASAIAAAHESGAEFISGFDDYRIMDGAGSIGEEVFQQRGHVNGVYVSIGGGGMGAGLSERFAGEETKVFCVELAHIPSATASMVKGSRQVLERVTPNASTHMSKNNIEIVADGITLPTIGEKCFEAMQKNKVSIGSATVDQIAACFALYIDLHEIDIETAGQPGAGVPELACMPAMVDMMRRITRRGDVDPNEEHVLVISGGNIDPARAKEVYAVGKEILESGKLEACLDESTPFYDPNLKNASRYSLPTGSLRQGEAQRVGRD